MSGQQEAPGRQEPPGRRDHASTAGFAEALAPELDRIAGLPLSERAAALGVVHERLRAALEDTPASAPEGA